MLSSWWGLTLFGVLTTLEFVGKCVPCVDALIDSVEIFIVPVISIFGSLSTFGLFATAGSTSNDPNEDPSQQQNQRELGGITDGVLIFVKVLLCVVGITLALLVHLFKLLVRLIGEGWCTCCITIVEYTWLVVSLCLAIFIRPIAIAIAVVLVFSAITGFLKRKKALKQDEGVPVPVNASTTTTTTTTIIQGAGQQGGGATTASSSTQQPSVPTQQQEDQLQQLQQQQSVAAGTTNIAASGINVHHEEEPPATTSLSADGKKQTTEVQQSDGSIPIVEAVALEVTDDVEAPPLPPGENPDYVPDRTTTG